MNSPRGLTHRQSLLAPKIEELAPVNIVFFCQSCGARFEVPPTAAGKKGRCKSCSQMMTVPKAAELASMTAMPALVPAAVGVGAHAAEPGNSMSWLAGARSSVALAPLTVDGIMIGGARRPSKPKIDDDLGDSKPYLIAEPKRSSNGTGRTSGRPVGGVQMLWRRNLGGVEKLFRNTNRMGYLVSVPFLLMIIFGAVAQSRPLALIGATAVVLLNIGRIVAGVANLAIIPFRESPLQGVMFLIPPLTFFYLASHWKKLKKPAMRIVGPIATIGVVFLAFLLIPTLRQDGKMVNADEIKSELRKEAMGLKGEMIGEAGKVKSLDVDSLGQQAKKAVGDALGKINSVGQPVDAGKTP